MPAPLLRGIGRLLDTARMIVPFDYPITHEATEMVTRFVPCDSSATIEQLGIPFRPMAETLRDTIRWLYEEGEISAKIAGQIANDSASQENDPGMGSCDAASESVGFPSQTGPNRSRRRT